MDKFDIFIEKAQGDLAAGRITRRQFLRNLGIFGASIGMVTAAPTLLAACSPKQETATGETATEALDFVYASELKWIQFEGISDPAFTQKFTEETGTEIKAQSLISEAAIVAQIAAGQIQADLAIVSMGYSQNYWFPSDQLLPLDPKDFSHWNDMFEYWQDASWYRDSAGTLLAIPHIWGSDSIIHNTDVVPDASSVAVLFEDEYKGKVAMPKNGIEAVAITAQYLGYSDPFNPTEDQLIEIEKTLIAQKPAVRTYWESIGDLVNLFTSGEVALAYGWLSVFTQVKDAGVPVAWGDPKEGQIGWSNGNGIIKDSPNIETAKKFIDYLISPDFLWPLYEKLGYRTTSQVVTDRLTPEDRTALQLNDPSKLMNSLVPWITPPEELNRKIDDLWARVLAS